jgi:hypothetical protein
VIDIAEDKRHLSMEEARRLGIVSFSAAPGGKPVDPATFGEGNGKRLRGTYS